MRSPLDNPSAAQNQDLVRVKNRGEAVRDDQPAQRGGGVSVRAPLRMRGTETRTARLPRQALHGVQRLGHFRLGSRV